MIRNRLFPVVFSLWGIGIPATLLFGQLQYVGSYDTPGNPRGVVVISNHAFVADYTYGLQIVNVSNPASPVLVGGCDTPGNAIGVFVHGNYAYVADYDHGLQIINVSNPAVPTLVGNYNTAGTAEAVFVAGSYAYVADGLFGLTIIDISTPSNPTWVGNWDTFGYATGVVVSGQYAYVADFERGLVVIDVSNPANPVFAGMYNTTGYSDGVFLSGDYAFVADRDQGLQVISVANSSNPLPVGNYNTSGVAYDVVVSQNYAYIADYYSLQVIDISNPADPTFCDSFATPLMTAVGVFVNGDYVYLADSDLMLIFRFAANDINENMNSSPPRQSAVSQNYPNPFNPATTIEYNVPWRENVTIEIFDALGQKVRTLVKETKSAGSYRTEWNGNDDCGNPVSTGLYLYRFSAGEVAQTKKMLLIK